MKHPIYSKIFSKLLTFHSDEVQRFKRDSELRIELTNRNYLNKGFSPNTRFDLVCYRYNILSSVQHLIYMINAIKDIPNSDEEKRELAREIANSNVLMKITFKYKNVSIKQTILLKDFITNFIKAIDIFYDGDKISYEHSIYFGRDDILRGLIYLYFLAHKSNYSKTIQDGVLNDT